MINIYLQQPASNAWLPQTITFVSTLIVGAVIAWWSSKLAFSSQYKLKLHEKELQDKEKKEELEKNSQDLIRYINMALCLETSNLSTVKKHIEHFEKERYYSRITFTPLFISINQKIIEDFMSVQKFITSPEHVTVIQAISVAETVYRKCVAQVIAYNEFLSDNNIEKIYAKNERIILGANLTFKGIKIAYEDCVNNNRGARKELVKFSKAIFGKNFKLAEIPNEEIVPANNLFTNNDT